MGPLLTIVGKDLRQRVRDRSVFIFGVLSPLALAAIFALVLPSSDGSAFSVGLVAGDDPFSAQVADGLTSGDGIEVTRFDDRAAASAAVQDGEVGAAVVLPAEMVATAQQGQQVTIDVLSPPDAGLSALVAEGIADSVASRLRTANLAARLAMADGRPEQAAEVALAAAQAPPALALADGSTQDARLDASSYLSAAMAVFFVFFVVQFGITTLLEERQRGTLQRLLVAPLRPMTVIVAKVVTSIVVGIGSMAVLLVASTFLLDASFGNPLLVALLTLGAVLAAVGLMSLVAAFARTPEQASAAQAIIGIVLGMLGGAFFPVGDDGVLGLLSRISPHKWYLRGLGDLAVGGDLAAIGASLAVLVLFFAAGLALAAAVLAVRPLEATE